MAATPEGPTSRRIRTALIDALAPTHLDVIDDSRKHAGHAHVAALAERAPGTGETHFNVKVVSEAFRGKSRIERHRLVNAVLAAELAGGVHALSIDAKAPGE